MAEDIAIDSNTFFTRLSSLYASWKADKRSGNALFDNAGSMVILMGKTDEENSFQKNNAMHVSILCSYLQPDSMASPSSSTTPNRITNGALP